MMMITIINRFLKTNFTSHVKVPKSYNFDLKEFTVEHCLIMFSKQFQSLSGITEKDFRDEKLLRNLNDKTRLVARTFVFFS